MSLPDLKSVNCNRKVQLKIIYGKNMCYMSSGFIMRYDGWEIYNLTHICFFRSLSLYHCTHPSIWFCTSASRRLWHDTVKTQIWRIGISREKRMLSPDLDAWIIIILIKKSLKSPLKQCFHSRRSRGVSEMFATSLIALRRNKAKADRPPSRERVRRKSTWSSFPVICPLTVQCQAYLAARDGAVMSPSRTTWKWR